MYVHVLQCTCASVGKLDYKSVSRMEDCIYVLHINGPLIRAPVAIKIEVCEKELECILSCHPLEVHVPPYGAICACSVCNMQCRSPASAITFCVLSPPGGCVLNDVYSTVSLLASWKQASVWWH